MKRILSIAALAALLLGSVSCHKQIVDTQGAGVTMKTVSVSLGDPATRLLQLL